MALGAERGERDRHPNPMSDDGDSKEVQRAEYAGAEKAAEQGAGKDERVEEARRIRRLQIMMSLVMSVISQDPDLTLEEAAEMTANGRRAALAMFPDKELAYDILYRPRLQRLMNERFRLQ
jgi:hypothetical protein